RPDQQANRLGGRLGPRAPPEREHRLQHREPQRDARSAQASAARQTEVLHGAPASSPVRMVIAGLDAISSTRRDSAPSDEPRRAWMSAMPFLSSLTRLRPSA